MPVHRISFCQFAFIVLSPALETTEGVLMKKTMLALAAVLAVGAVHAEDTLKKIKDSGSITMGVRESSGLSYTLGDGKFVGYHIDVCTKVIGELAKQVGKKLEVK